MYVHVPRCLCRLGLDIVLPSVCWLLNNEHGCNTLHFWPVVRFVFAYMYRNPRTRSVPLISQYMTSCCRGQGYSQETNGKLIYYTEWIVL